MLVKSKVKIYPDGTRKITVYKNALYTGVTSDDGIYIADDKRTDEMKEADKEHSDFMNLVRTRQNIQDYCLSNDFDMFWTLTFGTERKNDDRAFNRLSEWLKYMKKKYGLFDYIFIPERHKDGCIHFHGVTGGFGGEIVKATHRGTNVLHNGYQVYNSLNWKFGYSTITMIRDKQKTASYITKYVTKDLDQSIVGKGKKKYWSSRGLRRPVVEYSSQNLKEGCTPAFENDTLQIFND